MTLYDITFFNEANYAEFGKMLTSLLRFTSPFIMIGVAIIVTGLVISLAILTIRKAFGRENEGYQRVSVESRNRDDYKKYKY